MRVLVVADGTRGDVQPMTVIAQQLRSEGHRIDFVGPPSFREFVENMGLAFIPLPFDTEAAVRANAHLVTGSALDRLVAVPRLFAHTAASQLSAVPELAKHADFILAGGIHLGIPSAAEYARVPWRWVLYTSIMYPSTAHPPMISALGRAPRAVNWLLWQLSRRLIDAGFRASINQQRAHLGLAPIDDVISHILCRNPILAMEPELAPLPPEWPDVDVIGYLHPGEGPPLPLDLELFLARGPAPVYIGFGSMPDGAPQATTRLFVEATRRAGVRAVISRGWAGFGHDLPEHCFAVNAVSHARLFPRLSAIVHHGGAGTTAEAARAGRPQLVVPHVVDQFFFGNIVRELGIGVAPIRRTRLNAALLAERLRSLVSDTALQSRAAELGEKIRARPRQTDLSRLLVDREGATLPVVPLGRRVSIVPPPGSLPPGSL